MAQHPGGKFQLGSQPLQRREAPVQGSGYRAERFSRAVFQESKKIEFQKLVQHCMRQPQPKQRQDHRSGVFLHRFGPKLPHGVGIVFLIFRQGHAAHGFLPVPVHVGDAAQAQIGPVVAAVGFQDPLPAFLLLRISAVIVHGNGIQDFRGQGGGQHHMDAVIGPVQHQQLPVRGGGDGGGIGKESHPAVVAHQLFPEHHQGLSVGVVQDHRAVGGIRRVNQPVFIHKQGGHRAHALRPAVHHHPGFHVGEQVIAVGIEFLEAFRTGGIAVVFRRDLQIVLHRLLGQHLFVHPAALFAVGGHHHVATDHQDGNALLEVHLVLLLRGA